MDQPTEKLLEHIKTEFLRLILEDDTAYNISLEMAYRWLGISDQFKKYIEDKNYRRRLNSNLFNKGAEFGLVEYRKLDSRDDRDDGEQEVVMHFVFRPYELNRKMRIPYFTAEGFKMLCLIIKSPLDKFIRKYFIGIEQDYVRALKQTNEENKRELLNIQQMIAKTKSSLRKVQTERDALLNENNRKEIALRKATYVEAITDAPAFCSMADEDRLNLSYFRKTYMYELAVYVVDDQHVHKRYVLDALALNKGDCTIHNVVDMYSLLEYDQEYTQYDRYDIDTTELLYYAIQASKTSKPPKYGKQVYSIYVLNQDHIDTLHTKLKCYEIKLKKIYATDIDTIVNMSKAIINERLYNRVCRDVQNML